ncbi:MAG: hypothetical protein EOO09_07360 [Chitinophagaceae bacterium]|nr:MAG: hypothetical protein EOO09_07360 [Chitinophagaceae bacterium]
MKKFFGILAIAVALVACNDDAAAKKAYDDSVAAKATADSIAAATPPPAPVVDTTVVKVDTVKADSTKK